MNIKPLDKYEKPGYPELKTVAKKIRSVRTGKAAAAIVMAVAAVMSLTTCGTATAGAALIDETTTATELDYSGKEITMTEPGLAGDVYIEETKTGDETTAAKETALAGAMIAPEETALAGGIIMQEETSGADFGFAE